MKFRLLTASTLVILCALAVSSSLWGGSASAVLAETPAPTASADATTTSIRFIHVSPGTNPLDVYVDNQLVAGKLAFGASTDPVDVAPGPHDFALRLAGSAAESEPFFSVTKATLGGPGQSVALMVMGALDQGGDQRFRVRLYGVDRTPTNGKARLQIIHASPDTPAIDVYSGATLLTSNLAYPAGLKKPLLLDPGTVDLRIFPLGGKLTLWGERKQQELEADMSYVWVMYGPLGDLKTLFFSEKADRPLPTAAATEAPTPGK